MKRERGPSGWLLPTRGSAYSRLMTRAEAAAAARPSMAELASAGSTFRSAFQPGRGEDVLAAAPKTLWVERLAEYKRRKVARLPGAVVTMGLAPAPGAVAKLTGDRLSGALLVLEPGASDLFLGVFCDSTQP